MSEPRTAFEDLGEVRTAVHVPIRAEDWKDVKCRFGCDAPAVIVHAPKGCICWRDPVQALCMQHLITAESTGPITVLVDLRPPEHRK